MSKPKKKRAKPRLATKGKSKRKASPRKKPTSKRAGIKLRKAPKRKVSAKKAGTKHAPKRKTLRGKRKKLRKPRPVKRRLDMIRKAELILKRPEGTDKVGETVWLTPTTRGFDAVESIVRDVVENTPKAKATVEIYHYSVYVTFIGPNGQVENDRLEGAGLPFFPWIQKVRGKRERVIKAARDAVRLRVYEILSRHFDIISPGKAPKGQKLTEKQAERKLKQIRKGRDTKFKFVLYRTSAKKRGRK